MDTESSHTKYENFVYILVKRVLNFTFCLRISPNYLLWCHTVIRHFPGLEKSEFTVQRNSRENSVTNLISKDCARLDRSRLGLDNLTEHVCCHGWK